MMTTHVDAEGGLVRPREIAWPLPLLTEHIPPAPRRHWWSRQGRPLVRLTAPLDYDDIELGVIHVPAGFVSDGGSIPPLCWPLVGDPFGPGLRAFVLHDFGYSTRFVPRLDVDRLLYRSLRDCGLSLARRRLIYRAVRMFGKLYWGRRAS